MNSKWHLIISYIKSTIRIVGCTIGIVKHNNKGYVIGFASLLFAEIFGLLEEIGDKR